ncbi:MAG: hypothetical protein MJZ01_08505 [Bacteroidales bacterium]|nr:hypothetical protein [Bacteroidales bacterium]
MFDKKRYGFILGLILPAVTTYAFYYFGMSSGVTLGKFFEWFITIKFASSLIAVSALSNLAAFMGFAYSDKMNFARGIFMATLIWVVVVLVLKFIIQG